ncbi:MAG: hypothetical protein IT212_07550 [Bacteroidia bacterium]|nr:hypothetical protein [Bacteroidia bacterium]
MSVRTMSDLGGDWADTATWVEGSVPTAADDVVATATSGNLTIGTSINSKYCRSLNFTNYISIFTINTSYTLWIGDSSGGDLLFSPTMTCVSTGNATVRLVSEYVGTVNVTTNGVDPKFNIYLQNGSVNTNYTLQDNIVTTGNFGMIFSTLSNLFLNDKNITTPYFLIDVSSTPTLNCGTGTLTVTGSNGFKISNTVVIDNSSSFNIILNGTTKFNNQATAGKTWGNLTINGTTHTISGTNTFNTLTLSAGTTTTFPSTKTTTVTSLVAVGTSGSLVTIKSSSAGSAATISQATGTINGEWMSIKDSTATGGATFNVTNGTNVSGNTGWNFLILNVQSTGVVGTYQAGSAFLQSTGGISGGTSSAYVQSTGEIY